MKLDELNSNIKPELQPLLEERWKKNDVLGCLSLYDNMHHIDFILNNINSLIKNQLYEEVLIKALTTPRLNLKHIPLTFIHGLLDCADKQKMRLHGDALQSNGPFVLYRGVAGRGEARREKGISWTASLEKAIWFSKRFPGLEDPAVYKSIVPIEYVYAYTNKRQEQEFICYLPKNHKLERIRE
jgi:hypothetical protein